MYGNIEQDFVSKMFGQNKIRSVLFTYLGTSAILFLINMFLSKWVTEEYIMYIKYVIMYVTRYLRTCKSSKSEAIIDEWS